MIGSTEGSDGRVSQRPDPSTSILSSWFTKDSKKPVVDEKVPEEDKSWKTKIKTWIHNQSYIPNHIVIRVAETFMFVLLTWATMVFVFDDLALPGGEIFHLYYLVVSCFFMGQIFRIFTLPPLLGQLCAGICFRSVGFVKTGDVYKFLIPVVRSIAMAIILLKAGLGLELHSLIKLKWMIFKLTVFPCIGEAVAAAVIAHFAIGSGWIWSFLLGFLLSSISPAVVIPPLLHLKSQGYGEDKGIATVVIAASGLDDILSISCFSIFFSMLFKPSANILNELLHGPIDLIIGTSGGFLWGIVCALFPHRDDAFVSIKRSTMIALGGIAAVFASSYFNADSAGPIFCMISSFVACLCWKIQFHSITTPIGVGILDDSVAFFYQFIWIIVEPFLFGMIGAEIDLTSLKPMMVAYSTLIIGGALAFRMCVCFLCLVQENLNFKEMLFVNLAWMPKATVQAAIGSLPLDHLRKIDNASEDDIKMALLLLTTAVLSILITAPLGAICIQITGPLLLTKGVPEKLSP